METPTRTAPSTCRAGRTCVPTHHTTPGLRRTVPGAATNALAAVWELLAEPDREHRPKLEVEEPSLAQVQGVPTKDRCTHKDRRGMTNVPSDVPVLMPARDSTTARRYATPSAYRRHAAWLDQPPASAARPPAVPLVSTSSTPPDTPKTEPRQRSCHVMLGARQQLQLLHRPHFSFIRLSKGAKSKIIKAG